MDKQRTITFFQKHLVNPVVRAAAAAGIAPLMVAILETTGRKSGQPRQAPVGNGLDGDTFWIIAEYGRRAAFVRNIEANPEVRIKVGGRWRTGTAHLMLDDDPIARQKKIGRRLNAAAVRALGTNLLTVRVDLGPYEQSAAS